MNLFMHLSVFFPMPLSRAQLGIDRSESSSSSHNTHSCIYIYVYVQKTTSLFITLRIRVITKRGFCERTSLKLKLFRTLLFLAQRLNARNTAIRTCWPKNYVKEASPACPTYIYIYRLWRHPTTTVRFLVRKILLAELVNSYLAIFFIRGEKSKRLWENKASN